MGRKGIGKLAPFGICRRIEIISAGGVRTENGYLTSNFIMDFEQLTVDTDEQVELERGALDRTYREVRGTTVRLSHFLNKRVPNRDTFFRQLAARFGLGVPDFHICVQDTRPDHAEPEDLEPIHIDVVSQTRVDLSTRPIVLEDGSSLGVTGWMALAKQPYKHEELAGVRIYARGKIVANTRDFEQPAGFTGEFTMRSYLVGEVHAEWLDADDGDDLVRTDRQGILWESEYGRALRRWGADLIREIAGISRGPRRQRVWEIFLERSNFAERAENRFRDSYVRQTSMELARQIGQFAAEDELTDQAYVDDLADVILSVAPHKALIEAFREFNERIGAGPGGLEELVELFGKTRIAEMASYAQIAAERVEAIHRLETVITEHAREDVLQKLIQDASWLIEPTWVTLTRNQSLDTFVGAFKRFWKDRTSEDVEFRFKDGRRRPDFIAINIGHSLHIVEIKAVGHIFTDEDYRRLARYVRGFEEFFSANPEIERDFAKGWGIDLVCDSVRITEEGYQIGYQGLIGSGRVSRRTWEEFLGRAKHAHELLLEAHYRAQEDSDEPA